MKRLASILRATVPLAVAAAVLSASQAMAQTCVGSSKARPFKASFDFSEAFAGGPNPSCPIGQPAFVYEAQGTGYGTHLGRITVKSYNCVQPVSLVTSNFIGPAVTLEAANGDTLTATYIGVAQAYPNDLGSALFSLQGKFQILSGTGRFLGAQGCGDLSGFEKVEGNLGGLPASGKGRIELNGVIAY